MNDPIEMRTLVSQFQQSLNDQPSFESQTLHINDYIDRQLKHLVVVEEFDFNQIAYLLGLMFPEYKFRMGKKYCEERWTQIHLARKHRVDERLKGNRKLMAVMGFEDPQRLLKARELVKELEIQEQERVGRLVKQELSKEPKGESFDEMLQNLDKLEQFNITRDRVKKISQERYKEMELQYLEALEKAKQISEDMCEKPFIYKPKFIVDNNYQLEREDLTEEKAKEIVSSDIKLDSKIVGDFKDQNYQSKFKGKKQKEKEKQKRQKERQGQKQGERDREGEFKPRSKGIFAHLQNDFDDDGSDFDEDDNE